MISDTAIIAGGSLAALGVVAAIRGLQGNQEGLVEVTGGPERELLRAFGRQAEIVCRWPGLSAFLDVVAAQESGWKPLARNPEGGANGARGAYQIRPRSAFPKDLRYAGDDCPDILLSPQWATWCAVSYAWRCRGTAMKSRTFADLRTAWAYPSMVVPWGWASLRYPARRAKILRHFEARAAQLGHSGLESERAFPPGAGWPGSGPLAVALGIPWVPEAGSPCKSLPAAAPAGALWEAHTRD